MKRYDLRHLKGEFLSRLGEILECERGEIFITLFEIGDFSNVKKAQNLVIERGGVVVNSVRFNEVDWTIVIKPNKTSPLGENSPRTQSLAELEKGSINRPQVLSQSPFSTQPPNLTHDARILESSLSHSHTAIAKSLESSENLESSLRESEANEAIYIKNNSCEARKPLSVVGGGSESCEREGGERLRNLSPLPFSQSKISESGEAENQNKINDSEVAEQNEKDSNNKVKSNNLAYSNQSLESDSLPRSLATSRNDSNTESTKFSTNQSKIPQSPQIDGTKKISVESLSEFDFIATFGLYEKNLASDYCFYPFLDSKTKSHIKYEVGTEEGVAALLLYEILGQGECGEKIGQKPLDSSLNAYIASLDYGYLTSETTISEEEAESFREAILAAKKPILLFGEDILSHPKRENILDFLRAIALHLAVAFYDKKDLLMLDSAAKSLNEVDNLPENNGCVVYIANEVSENQVLRVSSEFAKIWKLQSDGEILISFDGQEVAAKCLIDCDFSGIIGILSLEKSLDCGYRFKKVVIKRA